MCLGIGRWRGEWDFEGMSPVLVIYRGRGEGCERGMRYGSFWDMATAAIFEGEGVSKRAT